MADIDLGFPEQRESAWLTNRYFPSKVGGKPAWLELSALPKEDLLCNVCKAPMSFLCQIYAPFDDEHNFHRSLYVFLCRRETCQMANSASNLTVLRSQLPRSNEFYSAQPPSEEGTPLSSVSAKKELCIACGCPGSARCAQCKNVTYCAKEHQRAHWPYHKPHCNADSTAAQTNDFILIPDIMFPEWEIVMEPNDPNEQTPTKAESECLSEFEKLAAEGKTGVLDKIAASELEKYALGTDDDKHFYKFRKEINAYPEQILRYKRNGVPLWIADVESTVGALQVPDCEYCSEPRNFEFQIMPQMLLILKDERLDWGVLTIYTCSKSCKPPADIGYVKEFIVKQDIAAKP